MISGMCRLSSLMLAATLLAGCAGQLPGPVFTTPPDPFTALVVESPWGAAPDEDVLALPPAVQPYIDQAIAGKSTILQKVEGLAQLFGRNGALGLEYELLSAGTAAETFESRLGSCLAYTQLYIAMARSIGIDARYREIIAVPQWDMVGDFALLTRHVAAYGEVPMVGSYVMDFGLLDRNERQFGRVISDERGRAQHFNNRGALALASGDPQSAVRYFNRALLLDRNLSFVWANLGTAYMRLDDWRRAEQALRHGLTIRSYEITAFNQLARLYQTMGRKDLMATYLDRSRSVRYQNPYLLFQRGVAARRAGELSEAITLLRRAVKTQPDEAHFYIELGRAYREAGELERARHAFLDANARIGTLEERAALLESLGQPAVEPQQIDVPRVDIPDA
jgi:Flp pilus assembly protein TadD